ncbi:MAG: hypothetical protein JF591_07225, partial [Lysobacter sp.]|nr:hypothetical protein [Lysobacter sp.]
MRDREPQPGPRLDRRRVCVGLALLPLAAATRHAFAAAAPTPVADWGIDLRHISHTLRPGDDFFQYVNQGWIDTAARPAGYAQYGELNAMFLRTEARIKTIIESAAAQPARGDKLADLYTSYADVAAIDRAGLAPIRADLDAILAIADHAQVAQRMAHPLSHAIVGCYVFLDAGNTRRSLLHLDQQTA